VIGPDLRVRRLPLDVVSDAVRRPFEGQAGSQLDHLLERTRMTPDARGRARAAILREQLVTTRFGGCWFFRAPMQGGLGSAAREAGLLRGVTMLAATHFIQSVLFVLSWWLLGRGLLNGTIDHGWLLGWVLLLLSLIPFRLLTSWMQGLIAITAGASLRRRLLRGALRVESQSVREKGAGQFFGLVAEASAVEALALSGGVIAMLASLELALSALVLWSAAGLVPVLLLGAWTAFAGWIAGCYVSKRRTWTDARLSLTHRLLEHLLGHRTRMAQQPPEQRHHQDDDAIDGYVDAGEAMDSWDLKLMSIIPRGWLALAMAAMAPAAVAGLSPGYLAASVGGVLLAYRALRRLTVGVSDLSGAAIAGHLVAPLVRAASRREKPTPPSLVLPPRHREVGDATVAQAKDLVFRYRPEAEPVLRGCSLRIPRGGRILVEGPSGSGKTTFASVLAGLQVPDSGLLLVDGLDRGVLGPTGWRTRVTMAPQLHDNYLLGGSLAFNLLLGRRWPAQETDLVEAEQVCRELGLGEVIDRMPGGLHQIVGETGWQLSQGERTRVFLARALLQQPELLVLDESFSALDPENVDRAVRCVMNRAPTLLAIAHT
jgi:ATP-binding cassette subfamily B protein